MVGEVIAFDEVKGFGTVRAGDGRVLFFHCTTIADGTRSIRIGAPVCLRVVPGHGGRWEAAHLEKL